MDNNDQRDKIELGASGVTIMRSGIIALLSCTVAACAQDTQVSSTLPTGAAAYGAISAPIPGQDSIADYRIGPLDTLDVTVFQEPELSSKALQVDASGQIALPLVGSVEAKGKTASELSADIEKLFGEKYLKDPQVTVSVATSVSQRVSIQGEVTEPGVYQVSGPTTLLEVLSMAKGETDTAKLNEVVIFRNINGQRMGAVFDVASIRRGRADDPAVHGNDMVVVGYSAARRFWLNVVRAAPIIGVF
ncbi:MAG TPA: polysaccharide biosynthesis/export family protein, partial [Terriglobales bacterium]|nr:polysaccharide biosynthesis/export family protein [Terriglobales bacterium]